MLTKLVLIILLLIGCAVCQPTIMDLGKYKATFDLGLNDNISVETQDPTEGELYDGTSTINHQSIAEGDDGLVQITITEFKSPPKQIGKNDNAITVYGCLNYYGCSNPVTVERKIDGYDAILAVGTDCEGASEKSAGIYWLSDSLRVLIYSRYPWEGGSAKLFKTIHIERAA